MPLTMSNPFQLSHQALNNLEAEQGDATLLSFNSAIDQILENDILDDLSFTDDFLIKNLPDVLNRVLRFGDFDCDERTVIPAFLAKVASVLQWSFSHGFPEVAEKLMDVLSFKMQIYVRNNGGQRPSKLWHFVVSRFLEDGHLELMQEKLRESREMWMYRIMFSVFQWVNVVMDARPSIDLSMFLLDGFAEFLEANQIGEVDGMQDVMLNYISMFLNQLKDNSALRGTGFLQKHVRCVMNAAPGVLASEKNEGLAFSMLNILLKSEQPEIFMEMSNCLTDNKFFAVLAQKTRYDSSANLVLANFGALMKPKYALEIWNNTQAQVIKDVVSRYELGQLRYLLSIADKESPNLADLLLSVANNCSSSNIENTKAVLLYVITELNASDLGSSLMSVLISMSPALKQQIYSHCVEHLSENVNYVHIACRLIESNPRLVTADVVENVLESIIDGVADLFPLYQTIVIKTERVIDAVQAELMVCCCGDELWRCFSSIVSAKGLAAFAEDAERVFMDVCNKTEAFQAFVESYVKCRNPPRSFGGLRDFPPESLCLLEHAFGHELLSHLPGSIRSDCTKAFVEYMVAKFNEGFFDSHDMLQALKQTEKDVRMKNVIRHQTMTPPNADLPLSVKYRMSGKTGVFIVHFEETQRVGEVLASIGRSTSCIMDQCELKLKGRTLQKTDPLLAHDLDDSSVLDIAGAPRAVDLETIPSCLLGQMGFTSALLRQMREGDAKPLELVEYLETDPAVARMVENAEEFIAEIRLVNDQANAALYRYLMKALLARRKSQMIRDMYKQARLGEIVEHNILKGQVSGADLVFLHAFGVDVSDEVIVKIIQIMTRSENGRGYRECLLILCDNAATHQEFLKQYLFGNPEVAESMISTCANEQWPQLRDLLLSLQATKEIYDLFVEHRNDSRYTELFAAVFHVLVSLETDDKLFDYCFDVLGQATEKDALKLLDLVGQRMLDPVVAESMSRRLLEMAATTELTAIRSKIHEIVFSTNVDAKDDYLWDLACLKTHKVDRCYETMFLNQTSFVVNLRGNQRANAIIQQLFNIHQFKACIFNESREGEIITALKRTFAFMELSKKYTVGIGGLGESYENLDFYVHGLPDRITWFKPKKNEKIDFTSCRTICAVVGVANLEKPSIPETVGDNYVLSGVIAASMANGNHISVIRRDKSVLLIGESSVQSISDSNIERMLQMKRLNPLMCFYARTEKHSLAFTIPDELVHVVKEKNDKYLKEKCAFSKDVCHLMLSHASSKQWIAYFFNVYLRTKLSREAELVEAKNMDLSVEVADIMQFAEVIPNLLREIKSDVILKCLVDLLTRVVSQSTVESGSQIVDLLVEKVHRPVLPILLEFCRKGQSAVDFCDSKFVGQKLCKLASKMPKFSNMSELFGLLTYFPVPDISDLFVLREEYAESGITKNMEALEHLFIFCCFSGMIALDDLALEPTDERVMNVLLTLLKRGKFDQVVSFMEEHSIVGEVTSEIVSDLENYVQLYITHPTETVISLLKQNQWTQLGENLVERLSQWMTPDVRDTFIDSLLASMEESDDKAPFLMALKQLQYYDDSLIAGCLEKEDNTQTVDILLEMAGSMVDTDICKHFALLLRHVKEGHLPKLACLMHAVRDDMAGIAEWNDVTNQLREADPALSKPVLSWIWKYASFRPMAVCILMRPDRYVDEDMLPYISQIEPSQDNLELLLHALNSYMEKDVETGVAEIGGKIVRECPALSFREVIVDIAAMFAYMGKHGCDENVVDIVRIATSQNDEFATLLRDDIDTQIQRNNECPSVVEVKMRLYASSIEDVEAIYRDAVMRLVDCKRTTEVLFEYFHQLQLPSERLTFDLFAVSPLSAKQERVCFKEGLSKMKDEERSSFVQMYAQSVNPLNPKPVDMRRLRFLIKNTSPSMTDVILQRAGIDRKRAVFLAGISEDMSKYCVKIFDLKPDELTEMKRSLSGPVRSESAAPSTGSTAERTPYFLSRPAAPNGATRRQKQAYGTPKYARP